MLQWLRNRRLQSRERKRQERWSRPIRPIDFLSDTDRHRALHDRVVELNTLLKYGHAADLPGYLELDMSDQQAVVNWLRHFIDGPIKRDLRPELLASLEQYKAKQDRGALGPPD